MTEASILRTIDAHGGWVASAIDLVRFATSVEGNSPPQVLSLQSVQTMVARPDLALWQDSSYHYGMGWLVRPVGNDSNWWHDGSLPGTYALVVRATRALLGPSSSTPGLRNGPSLGRKLTDLSGRESAKSPPGRPTICFTALYSPVRSPRGQAR